MAKFTWAFSHTLNSSRSSPTLHLYVNVFTFSLYLPQKYYKNKESGFLLLVVHLSHLVPSIQTAFVSLKLIFTTITCLSFSFSLFLSIRTRTIHIHYIYIRTPFVLSIFHFNQNFLLLNIFKTFLIMNFFLPNT